VVGFLRVVIGETEWRRRQRVCSGMGEVDGRKVVMNQPGISLLGCSFIFLFYSNHS
jgi:hypothetical protein